MKLQLYILRQLLVALAFSTGGLLFVALPGIAVGIVHKLPNADASVLVRYVPLVLQNLAPYALPICFLLAVVATYGRLAADREWTAILMAGVRPARMLLPATALAVALGAGTYWMVSTQLPQIKSRQRALIIAASTSSLENLRPGRTSLKVGQFLLEALWLERETGLLHEVYIRKPAIGDEESVDYHAKTADLRIHDGVLTATLTDLYTVHPGVEMNQSFHEWFEFDFSLKEYMQQGGASDRVRYLLSAEIARRLAAGEVPPQKLARYRFELHYRRVLSAAYLLFVGLGVPTGLILRKGTQLGALAASSGYAILYYILNLRLAKDLGVDGLLSPAMGAWAPTALGAVAAFFLLRRGLRR